MDENQQEAMQDPAYAPEFVEVMGDYAYENLRACLVALGVETTLVELLDDLMVLKTSQLYMKMRQVPEHYNEATAEAVARVSRIVHKLGGQFAGPDELAMLANVEALVEAA